MQAMSPKRETEPLDVKEACVQAAREAIAENGIEQLSLRDVARRLGVSHQAPYKHYPSRDHLIAEVMRRCFVGFAAQLDRRTPSDDPGEELASMGQLYLAYAQSHPLEYRLMFGTPWPPAAEFPELLAAAKHSFDVLRGVLSRRHGERTAAQRQAVDLDAMFIWSCVHGMATLMQSTCMEHIQLAPKVAPQLGAHLLEMISRAMAAAGPQAERK